MKKPDQNFSNAQNQQNDTNGLSEEQKITAEKIIETADKEASLEELVALDGVGGGKKDIDTCVEVIKALETEKSTLKEQLLRMAADTDNFRKRMTADMEKTRKFAITDFALSLLPVADSLERALIEIEKEQGNHSEGLQKIVEGIKLTQKELQSAFAKNNIVKQDSLGKIFNPNMDKVVQEKEDASVPAGTVLEQWQAAYTIGGDRVLREAIVVVAKS